MHSYSEFLREKMTIDPIEPRSVFHLDESVSVSPKKKEALHKILEDLPRIDCGACGAPSCRALAEDIVINKAELEQCRFVALHQLEKSGMDPNILKKIQVNVWGDRIKAPD